MILVKKKELIEILGIVFRFADAKNVIEYIFPISEPSVGCCFWFVYSERKFFCVIWVYLDFIFVSFENLDGSFGVSLSPVSECLRLCSWILAGW